MGPSTLLNYRSTLAFVASATLRHPLLLLASLTAFPAGSFSAAELRQMSFMSIGVLWRGIVEFTVAPLHAELPLCRNQVLGAR